MLVVADMIEAKSHTSGKSADLTGKNLRIIVKDTCTEIHYSFTKETGRPCGSKTIGIDKGYTEAFTDSNGSEHGKCFGSVLTKFSDRVTLTGKARNKLHVLEKKHRSAGNYAKADRIKKCNLGRIKLEDRKQHTQQQLRTIAYQSAHTIVDVAQTIVSEDLSRPITKKHQWKRFNRRMSAWAKGVLALVP